MRRALNRLSAAGVSRLRTPGLHHDGGGLYVQVTVGVGGAINSSWLFRFKSPAGRMRDMGMGVVGVVSLANARIKADRARALIAEGVDPIEQRKVDRRNAELAAASSFTFKHAAEGFLDARRDTWVNAKHRQQWDNTLKNYVYPVLGSIPVREITVEHVLRVINPIWKTKTETASRIRSRIERVLDYATARGWRDGDNPARWRGRLENVLPSRQKTAPVQHHPALPFAEMPAFMSALMRREGMGAIALQFAILTAARTSEVRGATWSEIDLTNKVWLVPANRMKAKRPHRVPLSDDVVSLLTRIQFEADATEFVFPGLKSGKPLSDMTLLAVLKQLRPGLTVHGFRSAFRDWTAESTDYPREVAEAALAHAVGDKVEAAYRRGDLFEKRRALMTAWAQFCGGGSDA